MKIKLVIADYDERYISKISKCIQEYYSQEIELTVFTEKESFYSYIGNSKYDALLFTKGFEPNEINKNSFYLAENQEEMAEEKAVCIFKYQRVKKLINTIYSNLAESKTVFKPILEGDLGGTKVVTFVSASGGTGKSICSATYAKLLALTGKKVLYFSIEKISSTAEFYKGNGDTSLPEIMYWIKSGKGNIPMKIESALQQDSSGVYFFESGDNPLELYGVQSKDWRELIELVISLNKVDFIVVDTGNALSDEIKEILTVSDRLVWICHVDHADRNKIRKLIAAYSVWEQELKSDILEKSCVVINQYDGKENMQDYLGLPVVGRVGKQPDGLSGSILMQRLIETRSAQQLYDL